MEWNRISAMSSTTIITIYDGASQLGTSTVAANGTAWTFTPTNDLAEGAHSITATATVASVVSSPSVPYQVVIDTTAPKASDIQTIGDGDGLPEVGDAVVFSFDSVIDANSVLSGWDGSSTNVRFEVFGNNAADTGNVETTTDPSSNLLGTVSLNGNYKTNGNCGAQCRLGATMVMSTVGGRSVVTVTFTSSPSPTSLHADSNARTMKWAAIASIADIAGNSAGTSTVTEGGTSDRDF